MDPEQGLSVLSCTSEAKSNANIIITLKYTLASDHPYHFS
jgi:hypothetical protein